MQRLRAAAAQKSSAAAPHLQAEQAHDQQRDRVGGLAMNSSRLEIAIQGGVGRDAQLPFARPQLPQRLCAAQAYCESAATMGCRVAPSAKLQAPSALAASLLM